MNPIAERNDTFRRSIPRILPPNCLLLTQGINALDTETVIAILAKVKDFDLFTPDNDPYAEHDFGSFMHDEKKIFWKIDDCRGNDGYGLVLTVMLAEEY